MNQNDNLPPLPKPPPPPRRGDDLDAVRRGVENNQKDWRRYREQWQKMLDDERRSGDFYQPKRGAARDAVGAN